MLDRLLDLYRSAVDRVVVVAGPSFESDVKRHVAGRPDHDRIDCLVQPSPTGMLDAILLASPDQAPRHIVISSCEPNDGKSTVALNLAIVLTQLGRRVLLVDADLRAGH